MTSFQADHWLRQGIAAAKAGDAARARELLLQVVDADEYNEQAWLWLSSVVDSDADREVCLENVLAINPQNNLAKAGLVHLRGQKAPKPSPPPEPPPPVVAEPIEWSPPEPSAPTPAADDLLEQRMAEATVPATKEPEADEKSQAKRERRRRRTARRLRRLARGLGLATLSGVALAVIVVAALFVLQRGPFDPAGRNYADAMDPLLADYDVWWDDAYGTLVAELNALCGPTADGWRNRDVLLNCSRYPELDCAHLAAHCESDVDAMRERMGELSQEAQRTGEELLEAFDDITPPDDIALDHTRFLACLKARVADAGQAGELARGELSSDLDHLPACQMFSNAEDLVRQYVYNR